ncbi:low molecular weight phosphotyrosine protein phosphatase [Jannaschia sp. W003]|uniref:arsenate reductase/protein-tyrosine-phosphatase family protein n=1 Tax=Jannaschia sp. W003 TaxID=2867012 RepID=UPI0021A46DF5|nr:low molecular weight phosphotyrosine protein phosphatase [Jannaschia sp. W003]UWQ22294.1 low molecular weight phosphotyrosine protein phosphatase [Jannaschia sp. W003]
MRILLVCYGNICRSPVAAAMLRALHPDWEVRSAGISPEINRPVHPPMARAAAAEGIELGPAFSRSVAADDLASYDRIVALDGAVLEALRERPGGERAEAFAEATGLGRDVPDPYYSGDFAGTLAVLREGLPKL